MIMGIFRPTRGNKNAPEPEAGTEEAVPDPEPPPDNKQTLATNGSTPASSNGSKGTSPNSKDGVRINPELTVTEIKKGSRPGDVYVRRMEPHARFFKRVGPGHFVATEEAVRAATPLERRYR